MIGAPSSVGAQQPASPPGLGPGPSPITITGIEGSLQDDEGLVFALGVHRQNSTREVLTYAWDFGDGTPPLQAVGRSSVSHYYRRDSTYTVTLNVRGDRGFVATRSVDVVVHNAAPVIRHLYQDPTRLLGEQFPFRAEVIDPGEDRLMYIWDYGDGSPPDSAVDLRRVSHRYQQKGDYTLTLTVRDEAHDPALRNTVIETIDVEVMPAWTATVTGALNTALEGYLGAPAMPNVAIVSLGSSGVCAFTKGLWDDNSKTLLQFAWHASLDSVMAARNYSVRQADIMGRSIGTEQATWNMVVAGIDPGYAQMQSTAASFQNSANRGLSGTIANMLRPASPLSVGSSGRTWAFLSSGGTFEVEAITEDRLKARFRMELTGHWQDASGAASGPMTQQVVVDGKLVWRFDASERANLAICQDKPFEIDEHLPAIEARNTPFADAEVSVSFTYPFRPQTINVNTFRVGYLNTAGTFQPIAGQRTFSSDGMTVVFHPADSLMDAVFYHVKLTGGQNGIKGLGDQELPDDYEYRFATMPDLVPAGGTLRTGYGGPSTGSGASDRGLRASLGGPSADDAVNDLQPLSLTSPLQWVDTPVNVCGRPTDPHIARTNKDIQVEVHVIQAACDEPLVPRKGTMVRVYADWGPNTLVDQRRGAIDRFYGSVRIWTATRDLVSTGFEFVRPDRYKHYKLRTDKAEHSFNFPDWKPDIGDGSLISATVYPTSDPRLVGEWFAANRPIRFWEYARPYSYDLQILQLQIGPWANSVPASTDNALRKELTVATGHTTANHPVNGTIFRLFGGVSVDPPTEVQLGTCKALKWNGTTKRPFIADDPCEEYKGPPWSRSGWLEKYEYYRRELYDYLRTDRPTIVLVPSDATLSWVGEYHPTTGSWRSDAGMETRLIFLQEGSIHGLAHELGHYFDLHHLDWSEGIEGYRIEGSFIRMNKSWSEGNEEAAVPMCATMFHSLCGGTKVHHITVTNYNTLVDTVSGYAAQQAPTGQTFGASIGGADAAIRAPLSGGLGRLLGRASLWSDDWDSDLGAASGPSALGLAPVWRPRLDDVGRAQLASFVSISGAVQGDGQVAWFSPLVHFDAARPRATLLPGPFAVALFDAADNLIRSIPFDPGPIVPASDPTAHQGRPFRVHVPTNPSLARVAVLDAQGLVIGDRRRSASPPSVTIDQPTPGAALSGSIQLSWTGADPDGDPLTYAVLYSRDGIDWAPLAFSYSRSSLNIHTARLPPGPSTILRVEATDGFDSAADEVTVTIRNGLPLLALTPWSGDTASVGTSVGATLNTVVDPATVTPNAISLTDVTGGQVPGTVEWDQYSNTLRFTPDGPLAAGAAYTATLHTGLSDPYRNRLAADTSWSFVTEPDMDAPRVRETTPSSYAITVFTDAHIVVRFDEDMDAASLVGAIQLEDAAGARVTGTTVYDARTQSATFTPNQPLDLRTWFQVTVTTGARDLAGNALEEPWTWDFETAGLTLPVGE